MGTGACEIIPGYVLKKATKQFHVPFGIWDIFLQVMTENGVLLSYYNSTDPFVQVLF